MENFAQTLLAFVLATPTPTSASSAGSSTGEPDFLHAQLPLPCPWQTWLIYPAYF
jgi:hypothetical protein